VPPAESPAARRLYLASLAAWIATLLIQWIYNLPLNHDEAAYAETARQLLAGQPAPWLYRSVGVNVLAVPGVLLGGSDPALRVVPILVSIAFFWTLWWAGRRLVGATAAAWACAVVAGTYGIALRGPQLLSDLPAVACLLVATVIIATELERSTGPTWRFVAIAPWLAAAFYLRYGSVVPIAVLGVAAVVVWPRVIVRRPLPVLAAAALFVVLLVPHFLHAIDATGRPLGILTGSSGIPRRAYVGEGLVTYLTANPFVFYGGLAPFLLVAGVASIAWPAPPARRLVRFLWLTALTTVVILGIQTHGTARYVYFSTLLLCLLGADLLVRAVGRRWPDRTWPRRVALVLVALSWLVMMGLAGPGANVSEASRRWTVTVADLLRRDAAGRPCHVLARHRTQLMWYGGCRSEIAVPADAIAAGRPVYVVWEPFSDPQPDLDRVVATAPVPVVARTILIVPWCLQASRLEAAPPGTAAPVAPPPADPAIDGGE
jgi:4-amino-4-deoxy-L-arabinose transferase-like glycosyltransferase